MPELPEAEAQRRLLDRCVVGQTIERVETKEQGGGARDGQIDDKVLDGDVASLAGSRVVAAKRKGKQLWLELDKGKTKRSLLIHLGMTGSCVIKGEAPPTYKVLPRCPISDSAASSSTPSMRRAPQGFRSHRRSQSTTPSRPSTRSSSS
jgi:formamidopyrimidine-DNA glycosylase